MSPIDHQNNTGKEKLSGLSGMIRKIREKLDRALNPHDQEEKFEEEEAELEDEFDEEEAEILNSPNEIFLSQATELLNEPSAYPKGRPDRNALEVQIGNAELTPKELKDLRTHLEHPLEGPTPQMQSLFDVYPTLEALKGAKDKAEAEIGQAENAIEGAKEEKADQTTNLQEKEREIYRLDQKIANFRKNLEFYFIKITKLKTRTDSERDGFEEKTLQLNTDIEDMNKKLGEKEEERTRLIAEIKALETKAKEATSAKSKATLERDELEKTIAFKKKGVHRYSSMGDLMIQIESWLRSRAGENPGEQAILDSVNEQLGVAREESAQADSHDLFLARGTPLMSLKATLKGFKDNPYLANLDMDRLVKIHKNKSKLVYYFDALKKPLEEEKKMKLVALLSKFLEQAIGNARSRGKRPRLIAPMKKLKNNLDQILTDYIKGQTKDPKKRLELREKLEKQTEDLEMDKRPHTKTGRVLKAGKKATQGVAKGVWGGVKGVGKGVGWVAKKGKEWWSDPSKDKKKILMYGGGAAVGVMGGLTIPGIIILTLASPLLYRKAHENPGKVKLLAKSLFLTPIVTYWDLLRKEGRQKLKNWWGEKAAPISTPQRTANRGDYPIKK